MYEIVNPKRKLPSAFFSRVGSLRVQVSLKEWRIFPQKRQLWVTIFARDETFKIDPLQLFHIFVRYVCCGDPASNILFKSSVIKVYEKIAKKFSGNPSTDRCLTVHSWVLCVKYRFIPQSTSVSQAQSLKNFSNF